MPKITAVQTRGNRVSRSFSNARPGSIIEVVVLENFYHEFIESLKKEPSFAKIDFLGPFLTKVNKQNVTTVCLKVKKRFSKDEHQSLVASLSPHVTFIELYYHSSDSEDDGK